MKNISVPITLVLACVLAGAGTHLIRRQQTALSVSAAAFKEFTLFKSEDSQSRSPDPMRRTTVEAYRGDGSKAIAEIMDQDPTRPVRRYLWLAAERQRVQVEDGVRAKTTWLLPDVPATTRMVPSDPQCGFSAILPTAKPRLVGQAELLGLKAVMIEAEHQTEKAEVYRTTTWKAPDLDCVTLKMSEDRLDKDGAVTGHFEMQVQRITVGPPAASLFEIPSDYAELKPSDLHAKTLGKIDFHGRPIPQSVLRRLSREDKRYSDNHSSAAAK